MAEKSLSKPWQAAISCGLCEGTENVTWYCLNCEGNLCASCKLNHLTDKPIFRKHRIVPKETATRQQSEPKETCSLHTAYTYTLYCYGCKVLLCTKCVTEKHNGHHLEQMDDALSQIKNDLSWYIQNFNSKVGTLAICRLQLTRNKKHTDENKQHFNNLRKKLDDKQKEVRKEVDQYFGDLLQHIDDSESKYESPLSESKSKLEAKQKEIRGIVQKAEAVLAHGSDGDVVKFYREKPTSSELQLSSIPQYCAPPRPGTDAGKLDPLTQRMERLERIDIACDFNMIPARIQMLTRHAPWKYTINMIATIGEEKAMIGQIFACFVEKISIAGDKIQTVPFKDGVVDFAITKSNEALLLFYESYYVYLLSTNGTLTRFFGELHSFGICITAKQEIVLCYPDVLRIYSPDGKKQLQSIDIKYMKINHYPVGLRENGNGDLCILWKEILYVVSRAGSLRFTYDGSTAGKRKFKFDPSGICCDARCNILIADRNNHTVDMLNSDGHFLGYLLTWRHQITQPTALCIDTAGKLWVGQYDGTMSIFKYSL